MPCPTLRSPPLVAAGAVFTWVKSQRKIPPSPGQFSTEINTQISRNLSDTVDLMKNSCVRDAHMEPVQKAADAAAVVAEYLQHELDTLPLPSRKPRVSDPLYTFVETIAECNKILFGDALPAVIGSLAEVIRIAPRVTRSDVDNILRNMHRR